jgi:hypothetical protein
VTFNTDQSVVMVANLNDVLYVNMSLDLHVDIDCLFQISEIRSILYSEEMGKFYILANKCQRLLGYYLIEFDEHDPC